MSVKDAFIGVEIEGYVIREFIGGGCIGKVYKARNEELSDVRAIKFIPMSTVVNRANWQQEIKKVNQLRIDGVVHYHSYGSISVDNCEYLYMMWDYVSSKSLKSIIDSHELTLQMLIDVVKRSLEVFHACKIIGIQHADFHSGNILVEDYNPMYLNGESRKIWITDFGCGTFSQVSSTPALDDYNGLARIIQEGLETIDFHTIVDSRERNKYKALKKEFPKYLLESNPVEGDYARNPGALLTKLMELFEANGETPNYKKNIGDFLSAELIGDRYEEWDALFVPKFLATEDLLDKNTCILTGLRGCGKTMMFRRLSFDLQEKLGPSGISGEDSFIGVYLNARVFVEAFPWLPKEKQEDARKQIINFFNVKWCVEILKWLKMCVVKGCIEDVGWLLQYFQAFFSKKYFTGLTASDILDSVIEKCTEELVKSKLGDRYLPDANWLFSEYSFLYDFVQALFAHHSYVRGRSFYLFLDDYSSPMINETMQEILNPIIFRRSANICFKVSTESIESFTPLGINGKKLESGADYKLIDLGSELLKSGSNTSRVEDIITSIFEKRIKRSSLFAGSGVTFSNILGKQNLKNTDLANLICRNEKLVMYYGADVFCKLWSSDLRELIKVFSEMLSREGEGAIRKKLDEGQVVEPIISKETQNLVLKDAGGRFLEALSTAINPNKSIPHRSDNQTYGEHLVEIVTAFQEIAYFDLKNKKSKNEKNLPPKQARKIELISATSFLSKEAEDYYKGLIRYGVFIQDFRAKSVRGTVSKRLYLRSLLIPYCRLTFSKRDCITLEWEDFHELLINPIDFCKKYKKKFSSKKMDQIAMFDVE